MPGARTAAGPSSTVGLTTRGRCLLAGGLAAAVCAVLLDERDLLRAGILAAVLPLLAALAVWLRRPRLLAARRAQPPHVSVGDRATVEIRLRSIGRLRSGSAAVTDPAVGGLSEGFTYALPPLRPGASAGIRYPLVATRRGRYALGALTTATSDPLGLAAFRAPITDTTELLVLPQIVPLTRVPMAVGARPRSGSTAQAGGVTGDLDVRVRPYTSGDDIRSIHWRASARRDEWVVRTRQQHGTGSATLLLDHRASAHAGRGADTSLETAVSLVASIADHLLADDFQLRLTTHRGDLLAAGETSPMPVLAELAALEPDVDDGSGRRRPSDSGIPLLCDIPGEAGLILAVTGRLTERDAITLIAARPPAARGIAFVADTTTWPGGQDEGTALPAAVAAGLLRDGGWRVHLLTHGADLAATWAAATTPAALSQVRA